jgi:hypothetical protein
VKPLLATEKAKVSFGRKHRLIARDYSDNATPRLRLSVVPQSGVGDHRALGTWHASRIMLMIPDTYLRSFNSSWDEELSAAKKIHARLRNCLKMSRLGLIFHGVSDGR